MPDVGEGEHVAVDLDVVTLFGGRFFARRESLNDGFELAQPFDLCLKLKQAAEGGGEFEQLGRRQHFCGSPQIF